MSYTIWVIGIILANCGGIVWDFDVKLWVDWWICWDFSLAWLGDSFRTRIETWLGLCHAAPSGPRPQQVATSGMSQPSACVLRRPSAHESSVLPLRFFSESDPISENPKMHYLHVVYKTYQYIHDVARHIKDAESSNILLFRSNLVVLIYAHVIWGFPVMFDKRKLRTSKLWYPLYQTLHHILYRIRSPWYHHFTSVFSLLNPHSYIFLSTCLMLKCQWTSLTDQLEL